MVHNDNKTVGFTGCHSVSTHWVCVNLGICLYICIFVCACHTAVLRSPHDKKSFLSQLSSSCLLSLTSQHHLLSLHTHTHTRTQSANQRSEKGHLCLPGLPGDKEEAVVRGIDPVGTSLADHYSAAGVSTAAVAAVMLQKKKYIYI